MSSVRIEQKAMRCPRATGLHISSPSPTSQPVWLRSSISVVPSTRLETISSASIFRNRGSAGSDDIDIGLRQAQDSRKV